MDTLKEALEEEIKKHKLYHAPKAKPKPIGGSSGKVKIFTDDEIRNEQGLGKKPFRTLNDNILWVVINKGPVTVQSVYEYLCSELKKAPNRGTVMATISQLTLLPYTKAEYREGQREISVPANISFDTLRADLYKHVAQRRKALKESRAKKVESWDKHIAEEQKRFQPEEATAEPKPATTPTATDLLAAFAEVMQQLFDSVTIEITFRKKGCAE